MTSKSFSRAFALRLFLFLATIPLFPLFIWAVVSLSGARGVGGAVGALALVLSMSLKPLIFAIFVFSLVGISRRRAKDIGLHPNVGLLIPILVAGDWRVGVFALTAWSFGFSTGMGAVSLLPMYLGASFVCGLLLASLPSGCGPQRFFKENKVQYAVLSFLSLAAAALAIFNAILSLPETGHDLRQALGYYPQAYITTIAPYVLAAFIAIATVTVLQLRRSRGSASCDGNPETAGADFFLSRKHRYYVLLGGAGITLLSSVLNDGSRPEGPFFIPIVMLIQPIQIFLPTFLLYAFLIWSLWRFAVLRSPLSGAILICSILPFVFWFKEILEVNRFRAKEAIEISNIPLTLVTELPKVVVYDGEGVQDYEAILRLTGASQLIETGVGYGIVRIDFPKGYGSGIKRQPINELPKEYLRLTVGKNSAFARGRQFFGAGGPYELRSIGPGRDDLMGVWYEQFRVRPLTPPIMYGFGWVSQRSGSTSSETLSDSLTSFLRRHISTQR